MEEKLYEFYWTDANNAPESQFMRIKAPKKKVQEILNKYRKEHEDDYNIEDFFQELVNNGIEARTLYLEPDYEISF